MPRRLWIAGCAVLAIGAVPAHGATPSGQRCHGAGRDRCRRMTVSPKPGRHYGSFPRATREGQPYADFITSPPPVRVALGRTGLLFTCQPGDQQAFIQGGWPIAKVKRDGSFGGRASVVQAPPLDPLFENATSGTETWSGRFTSATTGMLTLKVTAMTVSSFSPVGGGQLVTTPSTCAAGPKTFRITIIRS